MNAAFMFELPEVQLACWDFAIGCLVRPDNLQDMLNSAKLYADHKMTQELLIKVKNMIILTSEWFILEVKNELFYRPYGEQRNVSLQVQSKVTFGKDKM